MSAPQPKITSASFLHRLLRIRPGSASEFVCSRNTCDDTAFNLSFVLCFGAMTPLFLLAAFNGWHWGWLLASLALPLVTGFTILEPFARCERKARARLRRHECVWCGMPAGEGHAACPNCELNSQA